MPVSVPGGNPVTDAAGHIPTSPPVIIVGPILLTTGVAPNIPKLQAVPRFTGPGGGAHGTTAVVNDQVNLAASWLPKVSAAPVVIVAVYMVFNARLLVGVNVATLVAGA